MAKFPLAQMVLMGCVLGLLGGPAGADVLVTKSGTRYKGKITERGNSYILSKPSGGKMTFPKSMVREVIRPETSKPRYEKMLKDADPTDDTQVAKLAEFAATAGLTSERRKLLADAYAVRLAAVKGNVSRFRALAKWCTDYSLSTQAKECRLRANKLEFPAKLAAAGNDTKSLEKLAKWCGSRNMPDETAKCLNNQYESRRKAAKTLQAKWGLSEWCHKWKLAKWRDENQSQAIAGAAAVEDLSRLKEFLGDLTKQGRSTRQWLRCAKAIYTVRFKSAGTDTTALVKLSDWCRANDLKGEAVEAEQAALRTAPGDAKVREALGYTRDKTTGKWVQLPCPWRFKVVSATIDRSYSEGSFLNSRISYTPGGGMAVACVTVEFETISAATGSVKERLSPGQNILSEKAMAFLAGGKWADIDADQALKAKRFRLFLSCRVRLILPGGREVIPGFTSAGWASHGVSITGTTITWSHGDATPKAVLRYVRGSNVTGALIRPRKKIKVTLAYPIPRGTRRAVLRFYKLPLVDVVFKR